MNKRTSYFQILPFFRLLLSFQCGVVPSHRVTPIVTAMPKRRNQAPSNTTTSMCDMHADILDRIASSLSPPDAFSFVSTSKSLFWSAAPEEGYQPLGVKLVQAALRRRLDETLNYITAPDACAYDGSASDTSTSSGDQGNRRAFSLRDLFPPKLIPSDVKTKPQVLLSGSLAVMSVMGVQSDDVRWEDADVDIFCTWEAAPFVRQRLFENCGLICSGHDNSYMSPGPDEVLKFGDFTQTALSHVESYCSRPTEGMSHGAGVGRDYPSPYSSDAYFAQVSKWGAHAINEPYGKVGVPWGSQGDFFLYDYHLREEGNVQLIVGVEDVGDARELLNSFDLQICKCSFDGTTFRVPNALKSFAGHTVVTPARRALVQDFMRNVEKFADDVEYVHGDTSEMVKVLSKMTAKSWNGVGGTRFKETWVTTYAGEKTLSHDFVARYIFLTKLVERMQKYNERGVAIDDPPKGALDWEVAKYVEG